MSDPLETLLQLDKFANACGARKVFFRSCSLNPSFFQALCLLFDHSRFIHKILCGHSEIIEEILANAMRSPKTIDRMVHEMELGPDGDDFSVGSGFM